MSKNDKIQKGDTVKITTGTGASATVEVSSVYRDPMTGEYGIEGTDTDGRARYYKQWTDGGSVEKVNQS